MKKLIYCGTKEAEKAVLTKLELLGFRWASGHKPTDITYSKGCCDCGVYLAREHKEIYAGYECDLDEKSKSSSITAQDYLSKGKYKVVERDENTTKISDKNGRVEEATHENYYIAANLALEKFQKSDAEKLYNGKVKCVMTRTSKLTAGKIYEIKNGVLVYDDGTAAKAKYHSFEEFQTRTLSVFDEVK